MSTTRAIAHNTIVQFGGKIISTILGLIAIAVMTRYMGQEQFGWYVTVISFLGFIGILIDFGLVPVTAQMMSEPAFDKKQLLRNLLGFRLATAGVFFGLAPLAALFFPYPYEVKAAIAFTAISFLGVALNQVLIGYYQTKLRMHIPAIGELCGRAALLLSLFIILKFGASFYWVMGAVTVSGIVYTLALWIAGTEHEPLGFSFDRNIWKAIIKKMWPIAVSIIFNVVYLKGDIVLLSIFRDQAEIGVYGAAYRVLDIVAQLAMMTMGIMLPLLAYSYSRNAREDFKKYYQQSFDLIMLFALPVLVGLFVLAHAIMRFVAGDEFTDSGFILQILSIAVFGVYFGAIFGHAAVAIGRQKSTIWIYVSDAVITLIGYLVFIPRYGLTGAAWMTVFSELYAGILLFFTVSYYAKESLQWKTVGKILVASVLMGSALGTFPHYHILVRVLIGSITYAVALFALGAVSKETVREIVSFRKNVTDK